jgi:drug/metabolite transporter (DMT)-like permease
MLIVAAFMPGRRPNPRWMVLSALIYTAVVTLFIMATTLKTAGMAILLQYTQPVWCAIFAWYFLRRRIDRRTMLALIVASAGVAVMIIGQPRGSDWFGPMCGLLSGVAFGALILVLEQLDRASGGNVNPAQVVLYNNLGTILILLPIAFYKGSLVVPIPKIGAVAAVGVIQLALPYVLIQLALRRVQSIDASLLTLLEPVLNPLLVAMMTTERPDWATYVGGVAILFALVLEATKKPGKTE